MRKWLSELFYRIGDWLAPEEPDYQTSQAETAAAKQYHAEFIAAFERGDSLLRQTQWPAESVGTSIRPSK